MEQLYDLGVRSEYVFLLMTGLDAATMQNYYKRRVVSKGALMFFPSVFVGEIGAKVKAELTKRDGNGLMPNTCFFYDAAYLYFYATQYLVDSGHEDPLQIVKAMRDTHFYGCGGFIKIERGSNDRYCADHLPVRPLSTQPYQIYSPLQWPDDQPTYADSKPSYLDCPYLAEAVRDLYEGKIIGISVDFTLAFLTLIVTVVIWKRWWNVRVGLLTQKQPIMLKDVLVLFTVACDYFQFAAVGPDLANLSHFAMPLSAAMGYNMEKLINIASGVYWIVLDGALALVALWTLICFQNLPDWMYK